MTIYRTVIKQLTTHFQQITLLMQQSIVTKNQENPTLKNQLKQYLKDQKLFTTHLNFTPSDIQKISQFATYQLFLKLWMANRLTNSGVQPFDFFILTKTLAQQFQAGYKKGYTVFQPSILDAYLPNSTEFTTLLQGLMPIIKMAQTRNQDIIGTIYNTFLQNEEQQENGQHFTNVDEVDIVNAFCIETETQTVFDSGCGAGNFLVRAFAYLKYINSNWSDTQTVEALWGVEIEQFTAYLAQINLQYLTPTTQSFSTQIIAQDFIEIAPQQQVPLMDTCVGNPPYIRQELIANKQAWLTQIQQTYSSLPKLDLKSDLYVYYLIHTASFLKEGGRLGYVIASSWMDNNFGAALQQFLLQQFKIIAIIEQQLERSFNTAAVNTCILIIEKCNQAKECNQHPVKFIRLYQPYTHFIGQVDNENRFEQLDAFVDQIKQVTQNEVTKNWQVLVKTQEQIKAENTIKGKYQNGKWGAKYLRSPMIYHKMIALTHRTNAPLVQLASIATVKYGIKTGANDFFYLMDKSSQAKEGDMETIKTKYNLSPLLQVIHWERQGLYYSRLTQQYYILEKSLVRPLFKTQKEAKYLGIDEEKLKYHILFTDKSKEDIEIAHPQLYQYIKAAEQLNVQNRPTCNARISKASGRNWFNLKWQTQSTISDFIFPSKIGEYYRLIDNRTQQVLIDKVNYYIDANTKNERYQHTLFLLLNSTLFRLMVELFARQLTGAQTLSDVDVYVVKNAWLPDPNLCLKHWHELSPIYESLKNREQLSIFEEVHQSDRQQLDKLIFKTIGLSPTLVDELYQAITNFVALRNRKSASLRTIKKSVKR